MNNLLKLLGVTILIIGISSCCPRKHKLRYVRKHCDNIDYYSEIGLIESLDICIEKIEINIYTKAGQRVKHYDLEDNYSNWCDSICVFSKYLCLPEPLPTKYNWEVIINDSMQYFITDFELIISCIHSGFRDHYGCGILSYKINGVLVRDSDVKIHCKEHFKKAE